MLRLRDDFLQLAAVLYLHDVGGAAPLENRAREPVKPAERDACGRGVYLDSHAVADRELLEHIVYRELVPMASPELLARPSVRTFRFDYDKNHHNRIMKAASINWLQRLIKVAGTLQENKSQKYSALNHACKGFFLPPA